MGTRTPVFAVRGRRLDRLTMEAKVAGELGFEPRMNESESLVLPLHHSPTCQPSTTCPTDERYYSVVCLRCQAIFKSLQKYFHHCIEKRLISKKIPLFCFIPRFFPFLPQVPRAFCSSRAFSRPRCQDRPLPVQGGFWPY